MCQVDTSGVHGSDAMLTATGSTAAINTDLGESSISNCVGAPPGSCLGYQPVSFSFAARPSSLACLATREQQQGSWVMLSLRNTFLDVLNEGVGLARYLRIANQVETVDLGQRCYVLRCQ